MQLSQVNRSIWQVALTCHGGSNRRMTTVTPRVRLRAARHVRRHVRRDVPVHGRDFERLAKFGRYSLTYDVATQDDQGPRRMGRAQAVGRTSHNHGCSPFRRGSLPRMTGPPTGRLLPLAAAGMLTLGCSAVFGGDEIDTYKVEQRIARAVENRTGVILATVDCPDGIKAEPGREFQCIVHVGKAKAIAHVQIQNDQGELVWEIR
jgi:hypothetical protein